MTAVRITAVALILFARLLHPLTAAEQHKALPGPPSFALSEWLNCLGDEGSAYQSGRVGSKKAEGAKQSTEGPTAPGAPPGIDSSKPVLVTMTPEDFEACGLKKLSPEELERLDRWIFKLLVNTSVSPSGEIVFNPSPESKSTARTAELERQQMEAQLRDLQIRLNEIRQAAAQLSTDLRNVHFALQRRDLVMADSLLFSAETSVNRIQRAAQ